MPDPRGLKSSRANLVVSLAILFFLFFAWLVYVYENRAWIVAFQQLIAWLSDPIINYTPIQIAGFPIAVLATIEIIILGVLAAHTLLANEKDKVIKFISALGIGAGLTALVTIVLPSSPEHSNHTSLCWFSTSECLQTKRKRKTFNTRVIKSLFSNWKN